MICALFGGRTFGSGVIACAGGEWQGWAGTLALAIIAASAILAWRSNRPARARLATFAGFTLAALLMLFAVERPVLRETAGSAGGGGRLIVLVDGSESFWRDGKAARATLSLVAERVEVLVSGLPEGERMEAQILRFGRAAGPVGGTMPLANLPTALRALQIEAPDDRSDLAAGLRLALGETRAATGTTAVILISDAWSSAAVDDSLLADYRAGGVPIHVATAGASAPGTGLVAADIGHEHDLGAEAVIRATVLGGGTAWLVQGAKGTGGEQRVPESDRYRALRLYTAFPSRGLQGVTLGFDTGAGMQERSLFTLVRGPARLLVFGAAPWAEALPAGSWQVVRGRPEAPPAPDAFDLVVIDALAPAAFPPGYPQALLKAADGTGLLLINGGLRGGVDAPQVISDWNATPLNPILPVDSDPRKFVAEPPPRDVVVLVDVSGSMGWGRRLANAKAAINAILDQLRLNDTIAILPFNDRPLPPYARTQATAAGIDGARRYTASLHADGGTIPDETLRLSARFVSNYCAFFFISDADFAPPRTAPQCYTTAISVSDSAFPAGVSSWGEEIRIGESGNAGSIRLRYFEPEERDEYFRPEGFRPLPAGDAPESGTLPPVPGLAIAYPRSDARVRAIHPQPPPDPLIATRRDRVRPGVATGVFLGEMDANWGGSGLAATRAMLADLVGWSDQERYLIRLVDRGGGLRLSVTPTAGGDAGQPVSASVLWEDGAATGISLAFDPRAGSWAGMLRTPAGMAGQRALLVLQQGDDVQRIPLGLPPRLAAATAPATEAAVWGVNHQLATHLRHETGGRSLDRESIPTYSAPTPQREHPLHALLLVFAAIAIAGAVWAREARDS